MRKVDNSSVPNKMSVVDPEKSIRRNLNSLVKVSSKSVGAYLSANLPTDLTESEYILLGFICLNEGKSTCDIASSMGLAKGTVSETIKSLIGKGFVFAKQSEKDRRRSFVYPTEKAKRRHDDVKACFKDIDNFFEKGITAEERDIFVRVLEKLENNIVEGGKDGQ